MVSLTVHFSPTTSKKTIPTTRKVDMKTARVTNVLRMNKPEITTTIISKYKLTIKLIHVMYFTVMLILHLNLH